MNCLVASVLLVLCICISGDYNVRSQIRAAVASSIEEKALEWRCLDEFYDDGKVCDCACGSKIDPDCLGGDGKKVRCQGIMESVFPLEFGCDVDTNECTRNDDEIGLVQQCSSLYRHVDLDSKTCGECMEGYFSPVPMGQCRFKFTVSKYAFVPDEEANPLRGIKFGQDSAVTFVDINGDSFIDVFGSKQKNFDFYLNIDGTTFEQRDEEMESWFNPSISSLKFAEDARIGFYDFDGDQDFDCVMTNQNGRWYYYENVGNVTSPQFNRTLEPFQGKSKFDLGDGCNVAFFDANGDGLMDIFSGSGLGRVYYLMNIGNETHPVFERIRPEDDRHPLSFVDVGSDSFVNFFDFDDDGDEDCIVGEHDGKMFYFRNDGNATNPLFVSVKAAGNPLNHVDFGSFPSISFSTLGSISDERTNVFIGDLSGKIFFLRAEDHPNKPSFMEVLGEANPLDGVRFDTWSKIAFVDLYDRGLMDAIISSKNKKFYYLRNVGIKGKARFVEMIGPDVNPLYNFSTAEIYGNVAFVDIDGDGDLDAFQGVSRGPIQFLLNIGNKSFPVFQKQDDLGHQLTRIKDGDVVNSYPAFVDIDDDGDFDCFVGSKGGAIFYWENIGNATYPEFIQRVDENNTLGMIRDISNAVPTFFDIDQDGDYDAMIGNHVGTILFYRNEGNKTHAKFMQVQQGAGVDNPFEFINVGLRSQAAFVDIDGDGDVDLFVGEYDGNINFFQNTENECPATECTFGRGFCGETGSVSDPIMESVAASLGFRNGQIGFSAGGCLCGSQFAGSSCEQCAPGYHGIHCDHACPARSFTNLAHGESAYPKFPTLANCECKESFQMNEDQTECVCAAGMGFNPGTDTCVACPVGMYKDQPGNTPCVACVDRFGPRSTTEREGTTDASGCICEKTFVKTGNECVCEENFFGNPLVDAQCAPCPQLRPFTNDEGRTRVDECVAGPGAFVTKDSVIPFSCSDPKFAGKIDCPAKGATLQTLSLKPGFWRIADDSFDIRRCPFKEYCNPAAKPGNINTTSNDQAMLVQENDQKQKDLYCSPLHTGVMCASCVVNASLKGNSCTECTEELQSRDQAVGAFLITLCVLVLLLPSLSVLLVRRKDSMSSPKEENCFQRFMRKINIFNFGHVGVKTRLLFGFCQVYFVVTRVIFSVSTEQSSISKLIQVLVNIDLTKVLQAFDVTCFYKIDFYRVLLIYTLVPLMCFFIMSIALGVLYCVDRENKYFPGLQRMLWITFQILFFIYPAVSSVIFASFIYDEIYFFQVGNGERYRALRADYSIDYDDDLSSRYRIYAAIMVFVYPVGGIALFTWGAIYDRNWRTEEESGHHAELDGSLDEATKERLLLKHSAIATATGFLIMPFHRQFYWFECYELGRKLIMTAFWLLIHQASNAAGTLSFVLMCFLFYTILSKLSPYKAKSDQVMAELSMILLIVFATLISIPNFFPEVEIELIDTLSKVLLGLEFLLFLLMIGFDIYAHIQSKKRQRKRELGEEGDDSNDDDGNDDDGGATINDEETPAVSIISGKETKRDAANDFTKTSIIDT